MRFFILILSLLISSFSFATPLSGFVVFGDSLSDNGNLYEFMHHQLPQSPPYYKGRFSNGPIWIDNVAQTYFPRNPTAHVHNYAFGGAGVLNDLEDDDVFFTLKREVDTYLLAHNNQADPHHMFFIWIGGNNYLSLPEDMDNTVNEVMRGMKESIERLIQAGATYITLGNLPDLGKTPLAAILEGEASFSAISKLHNQRLNELYQQLQQQHPEVRFIYLNIEQIFDDIFSNPQRYTFNNLRDTCYDSIIEPTSARDLMRMTANLTPRATPEEQPAVECAEYLFFDFIHPTTKAHAITANTLKQLFAAANITFEE